MMKKTVRQCHKSAWGDSPACGQLGIVHIISILQAPHSIYLKWEDPRESQQDEQLALFCSGIQQPLAKHEGSTEHALNSMELAEGP